MKYFTVILAIFCITSLSAEEARFVPPEGWRVADEKALPPHTLAMVVGTGKLEFPPSINLCAEAFDGTLQDYIEIVKGINKKRGSVWKDLGKIQTEAGEASLSQADTTTKWGKVRMMHVILVRDNTVYILTAAALQSEFAAHYKSIFDSLRSFSITE